MTIHTDEYCSPKKKPRTETLAVLSFVLGIMSVLGGNILTGIPAVICGHVARSRIKKQPMLLTGSGLAFAGLITGYIDFL